MVGITKIYLAVYEQTVISKESCSYVLVEPHSENIR